MNDQNLSPTQVLQITQTMLSVARVDGIQSAEAALIGQFYEASRSAEMPPMQVVITEAEAQPFKPADLAGSTAEFADTVILMCLMTAYADGQLSQGERKQIQDVASALGVDSARVQGHLAHVRDELIGALSHLPDAASVAAVVGELAATD
jgi:tellurite resistance protein